jgi:hypothetical protein
MNEQSRPKAAPTQPAQSIAPGTALQTASLRLLRGIEEAAGDLDDRAYTAFIDLGWRRFTREAIRIGLDGWRAAA